jgi:hypothetical protein
VKFGLIARANALLSARIAARLSAKQIEVFAHITLFFGN